MTRPRLIRKRWWFQPPWRDWHGLTIHPLVFLRPGWSETTCRHELIHCWQVIRQGWWRFYGRYVWLAAVKRVPYRELPAEAEAFANEGDPDYLPYYLERLVRADA